MFAKSKTDIGPIGQFVPSLPSMLHIFDTVTVIA